MYINPPLSDFREIGQWGINYSGSLYILILNFKYCRLR